MSQTMLRGMHKGSPWYVSRWRLYRAQGLDWRPQRLEAVCGDSPAKVKETQSLGGAVRKRSAGMVTSHQSP